MLDILLFNDPEKRASVSEEVAEYIDALKNQKKAAEEIADRLLPVEGSMEKMKNEYYALIGKYNAMLEMVKNIRIHQRDFFITKDYKKIPLCMDLEDRLDIKLGFQPLQRKKQNPNLPQQTILDLR